MAQTVGIFNYERLRAVMNNPALNWRWAVHLPPVRGFVTSKYSFAGERGVSFHAVGHLSVPQIPFGMIESVDIPPSQIDMDSRFGSGFKIHYPRFSEAQQITINFYEDGGYNTTKYLMAWKREIIDENHNYGLPVNYKKELNIFAFDILSNFTPTLQVQLVDCWPLTPVGGLSYSHDANGFIVVNCEFAVDKQNLLFTRILNENLGQENPRNVNRRQRINFR